MDVGVGLDVVTNDILPNAQCLEMPSSGAVQQGPLRRETVFRYTMATGVEDLRRKAAFAFRFSLDTSVLAIGVEASFLKRFDAHENSVFLIVEAVTELADHHALPRGLADAGLESLLASDYDSFRARCGDRFLTRIISGTSYRAIVEIAARSTQEQLAVAARVSGIYKSLDVAFAGSLSTLLDELARNYNYSVHVLTRGEGGELFVPGAALSSQEGDGEVVDLEADIEAYLERTRGIDTTSDLAATYPLKAVFTSYAMLSPLGPEPNPAEAKRELLADYARAVVRLEDEAEALRHLLADPDAYQVVPADIPAFGQRRTALLAQAEMLRGEIEACEAQGVRPCTPLPAEQYLDLAELESAVPERKVQTASSCAELQQQHLGVLEVGYHVLHVNNEPDKPYWAYCDSPSSSSQEGMATYLPLRSRATAFPEMELSAFEPTANFSKAAMGEDPTRRTRGTVVTLFDRVPVRPFVSGLIVDSSPDGRGTTTLSTCRGEACPDSVPFAAAHACDEPQPLRLAEDGSYHTERSALARIDLRGSPFEVHPGTRFSPSRQPEIVRTALSCAEAFDESARRGGRLLSIRDDEENGAWADYLAAHRLTETWLNLKPIYPRVPDETLYGWYYTPAVPNYRNWAEETRLYGAPPFGPSDLCATMTNDGWWWEEDSRVRRAFVVEYEKADIEVEFEAANQVVTVYVQDLLGNCARVKSESQLMLLYRDDRVGLPPGAPPDFLHLTSGRVGAET
jgi:hypothetical protein